MEKKYFWIGLGMMSVLSMLAGIYLVNAQFHLDTEHSSILSQQLLSNTPTPEVAVLKYFIQMLTEWLPTL